MGASSCRSRGDITVAVVKERLDRETDLLWEWRGYHCCGSEGKVRHGAPAGVEGMSLQQHSSEIIKLGKSELLREQVGKHCCSSEVILRSCRGSEF
ncbi:hypothetical protein PO909_006060 [Leuciscus waleckii]